MTEYVYFCFGSLRIFGRLYTREEAEAYGDSWPRVDHRQNGGHAFGEWFSEACIDGEAGSNPVQVLVFISEAEFKAAENNEWNYTPSASTITYVVDKDHWEAN